MSVVLEGNEPRQWGIASEREDCATGSAVARERNRSGRWRWEIKFLSSWEPHVSLLSNTDLTARVSKQQCLLYKQCQVSSSTVTLAVYVFYITSDCSNLETTQDGFLLMKNNSIGWWELRCIQKHLPWINQLSTRENSRISWVEGSVIIVRWALLAGCPA